MQMRHRKIRSSESAGLTGVYEIVKTNKATGKVLWRSGWQKNLIMLGSNTGKTLILNRLASINTYSLNITHLDIGTSATTPTAADTGLGAAVYRQAFSTMTVSGNQLTASFYLADANLANGTYYEIGTFVDGSSGTGTGQIFNHALFASGYVKSTGEDTTINVVFIIN